MARPPRTATARRPRDRAPAPPNAVVVTDGGGHSLEEALDAIGMADMLMRVSSARRPAAAVAIAADGAVPRSVRAYLIRHGTARITTIALASPPPGVECGDGEVADPACRTSVSADLELSTAWAESDVRLVVSRVKTDRNGEYLLCGAALKACVSRGDLSAVLDRYPAHCSIVVDPAGDTPAVVADHPLLADWIGATLMGRDPFSAPADADWFRRGLLPRAYRVRGDTRPIDGWRNPPSLVRDLPQAVYGPPVISCRWQGVAAAAEAWSSYVRSVLEPFLPVQAGANGGRPTREILVERIAAAVSPESLGELLEALLQGLGFLMSVHPALKDEVRALRARYRLTTQDGRMSVTARFSAGTLNASRTDSGPANVTLIFKDTAALLGIAASPKPDLLGSMLRQDVAFDGNLNYLLKLAYFLRRVSLILQSDQRRAA